MLAIRDAKKMNVPFCLLGNFAFRIAKKMNVTFCRPLMSPFAA
jgi:hypothetical protein